jgi:NAD+ synthetase
MALSNKFGWIVLSTGNKSEMSVGYSTLYGDSAGGFAVIKDVPKNLVYRVSREVNRVEGREVIPESVLDKEPSPSCARPARHRLPAALRGPRPHPRGLHRGGQGA